MVHLTWPSSGLGLKYRVYLLNASGRYVRVTTVWQPRATVNDLSPGTTYQFQVVPTNIYDSTGPAAYTAVRIP